MEEDLRAASDVLTDAEDALLIAGSLDGKNQETRDAQLRAATQPQRLVVRTQERALSRARGRLRVYQTHFSAVKSQVLLVTNPPGHPAAGR